MSPERFEATWITVFSLLAIAVLLGLSWASCEFVTGAAGGGFNCG